MGCQQSKNHITPSSEKDKGNSIQIHPSQINDEETERLKKEIEQYKIQIIQLNDELENSKVRMGGLSGSKQNSDIKFDSMQPNEETSKIDTGLAT